MKIKQTKFIIGYLFAFLFMAVGLSAFSGPSAHAYVCPDTSIPYNGAQYKLQGGDGGGACYMMVPDENVTDSKKVANIGANGQPTGTYHCVDSVQHDDGTCWTNKKVLTNIRPTYDDGTQIPDAVYDNICKNQGSYFGVGYHYNKERNACESGALCGGNVGPVGVSLHEGCRSIGDGTQTPSDYNNGGDPTTAKVKACTDAKAKFNTTTHECDWDPVSCPAKNGGQGVWDSSQNKCNAYSDYTSKDKCDGIGGNWLDKGPNASGGGEHFECVKPGTTGSPQASDPQHIDQFAKTETYGDCGLHGSDNKKVETVLIGCDQKQCATSTQGQSSDFKGTPVISCVMRFGVSALTVLVGVGAVAGIAWEALQYARAQDDQSIVSNAKKRIRDIIIGLVVYVFMLAFVNWLIPGGVIG